MIYQEYLNKIKEIQKSLLDFLESENDVEENFQNLIFHLVEHDIRSSRQEMKIFLYLISKIVKNHNRESNFFEKIKKTLQYLKDDIKSNLSNYEIFKIFKSNKIILLFCIQNEILNFNHSIYLYIIKKKFDLFFQTEILDFIKQQNNQLRYQHMANKLSAKHDDDFNKKRNLGENDNYISKIIREDLIEEFITYVNQNGYSLNSTIQPSIYETNSLLIKKEPSLIEYAAFFGSIQIFKYLYNNGVKLTPSLWIYGIHGFCEEMIHILEEKKIKPSDKTYEECLKESIKCHHNGIANYIINNLLKGKIEKRNEVSNFENNLYSYGFHYHNYLFLPDDENKSHFIFHYACKYDYFTLVDFLYKTKKTNLYEESILKS